MALSHKGRYWQISGLEKQVGLRAIIYISAPAGECSKGEICALFGGGRGSRSVPPVSDAPSPPGPFFLTPPEGAASQLSSLGLSIQALSRQLRPSTFRPPISMATLWR